MKMHDLPDILAGIEKHKILNLALKEAHLYKQFDFGNLDLLPDDEKHCLHRYEVELIKNDCFTTPYDFFSFSFTMDNSYSILNSKLDSIFICNHDKKENRLFVIWIFRHFDKNKGCYNNLGSILLGVDINASKKQEGTKLAFIEPVIMCGTNTGKKLSVISSNDYVKSMSFLSEILFSMFGILDAENVERIVSKTPERINKKRVKRGQLAIADCETIYLRVGGERYLPSGESVKGHHASPRCHWRRGHLRHMSDGRIFKVRPCLVGKVANENPLKKNYVIKRAG